MRMLVSLQEHPPLLVSHHALELKTRVDYERRLNSEPSGTYIPVKHRQPKPVHRILDPVSEQAPTKASRV